MLLKEYYKSMYRKLNEAEVDDDQMISFKSSDGENKEMAASSAKKMEKDHPAKIAYDKLAGDEDDGGDSKPGVNIFDEPSDDEPKVPAPDSRSDTGKPRVSANPYDDNFGQEVDDAPKDEPSDDAPKGEPKGEPSAWSQKAQKAKDDLEALNKWGADPEEIGAWIEDNQWSLSGGKLGRAANLEFAPVQKAYDELEDAYTAAEEEGDWDVYDKAKEDFTKLANQKLGSQKDKKPSDDNSEESFIGKRGVAAEGSFRKIQEQWIKNNIL